MVMVNPGLRPGLIEAAFQAGVTVPEGDIPSAQGEALGFGASHRRFGPEGAVQSQT